MEFTKVIGPLTDPAAYGGDRADAFHVVIPSLPGYGFSGKPTETGYNPERMADVLAGLMERLGYDRYGAQGGDWGAVISRVLAGNYGDRLIGLHSNRMTAGHHRAAPTRTRGLLPESWSADVSAPKHFPTTVVTRRFRAPSHRQSAMDSMTPPLDWPPGSSRSSTAGVTTTGTSRARSPKTRY